MLTFAGLFSSEVSNAVASVEILETDADSSTFLKFLKLVVSTKDFMVKVAPHIMEGIFRNELDIGIDRSGMSDLLEKKLGELRVSIENKYFTKLSNYTKGVVASLCLCANNGVESNDSDLKAVEACVDLLSKAKGRTEISQRRDLAGL